MKTIDEVVQDRINQRIRLVALQKKACPARLQMDPTHTDKCANCQELQQLANRFVSTEVVTCYSPALGKKVVCHFAPWSDTPDIRAADETTGD